MHIYFAHTSSSYHASDGPIRESFWYIPCDRTQRTTKRPAIISSQVEEIKQDNRFRTSCRKIDEPKWAMRVFDFSTEAGPVMQNVLHHFK